MKAETYPFVMRSLPYEYFALAPCISMEAVTYHHDKIYKHYVDQLNLALANYPQFQELSLWELLAWPENLPEGLQTAVKKNGGGAFCHELYFDSMQPLGREQDPKGVMLEALIQDFGSLKDFRDQMSEAAVSLYASGYAWLVMEWEGRLQIKTTANEEVPSLRQEIPILCVDVWEHSYYLQYRDRRKDYVSAWHRLINWRKAARRYEEALQYVREERMLHGEGWLEHDMEEAEAGAQLGEDEAAWPVGESVTRQAARLEKATWQTRGGAAWLAGDGEVQARMIETYEVDCGEFAFVGAAAGEW